MTDRELMQQALEALDGVLCDPLGKCCIDGSDADRQIVDSALDALRERLTQPEQEPLQWQGLTADEIWKCNAAPPESAVEYHICMAHQNVLDFAEAIEAKLREKNS